VAQQSGGMAAALQIYHSRVAQLPEQDPNLDLGFGSVVSREVRTRLLNRDGTFNVRREGLSYWARLSFYHYSLTLSWPRFLFLAAAAYFLANALFALLYVACGPHALTGFEGQDFGGRFLNAFFFSVDTLATIGYGNIAPLTLAANLLVTVEALVGLLGFSVLAGLVFARFSRPVAQIVFSENAIIAPYRGITALMFRVVNQRTNEIVQLAATVMMTRRKQDGSAGNREYIPLRLERDRVVFFPATWTIVHPVDEQSPLWQAAPEDLIASDAEILVLLNGFDETYSQTVHTRSSYKADEIVWGARFRDVFNAPRRDGTLSVDIRKLHEIDKLDLA
jgi:inward rectifier potassium channel